MKKIIILALIVLIQQGCANKPKIENKDLKIKLQPVAKHSVLGHEDYYVWGGSMVQSEDDVYNLFYSRWPKESKFRGWLKQSEVAHAVSNSPTGPYTFKSVALTGVGEGNWNEEAAHNPHIKKFGDKYYLYFISHTTSDKDLSDWMNHIYGQRIGVAVSDSPNGPWEVSETPLIDYQEGKPAYGYMVNPSVCERPDGTYLMMFKARKKDSEKSNRFDPIHCLATAPTPTGPFTIAEQTLLTEHTAEDPFVWMQNDTYYAIVKDMHGKYTGVKSLALFESANGIDWGPSKNLLISKTEITWEDNTVLPLRSLERPQVWFDKDGNPSVLFCAAGKKGNRNKENTFNVQIPIKIEWTEKIDE
ncbi:glycoside hydrolase family protein [Polaribacter sp.]|uniref:glycoside hydrolase family protein n=1 Tax=Polaribacter sp. TaxID=1920175 RepID=UPI0025E2276F|nr:glycoside hydrolase family protein [Polaribacter sp.]